MEQNVELKTYAEEMALEACSLDAFASINLLDIKKKITEMLSLIGRGDIFDEYTKHDISHIDKMLLSLEFLIPDETKSLMTKADWLLITLSFYFHDLGMLVTKDEYVNREQSRDFCEFREVYIANVYNIESLKYLQKEEKEHFIYHKVFYGYVCFYYLLSVK